MLFKLGVRDVRQLPNVTTLLGRRKKVDVRLYGEILRDRPESDRWLPLVVEFLHTTNRAVKRTEDARFEEFDAMLFNVLTEETPTEGGVLGVHDLGVSDGRTAVALYRRLHALGSVDFTASDLFRAVFVVLHTKRGWSVAFDEDGRAIQYAGWRFVLSPPDPDLAWLYPVNRALQAAFGAWLEPQAARALLDVDREAMADLEEVSSGPFRILRVPLVCRECMDLIQADPHFHFVRHDVRRAAPGRFGLIRAMNVLNHLSPDDQQRAFQAFRGCLVEGGVLAVGRSADPGGETRASVWRRRGDRFERVRDLHGGAELADQLVGPSNAA